jgi:hypothetical protein
MKIEVPSMSCSHFLHTGTFTPTTFVTRQVFTLPFGTKIAVCVCLASIWNVRAN